jgi:hypothetical protein
MEPFPESATFDWAIGLGISAVLVTCAVIGLILRAPGPEHVFALDTNEGWDRASARGHEAQ